MKLKTTLAAAALIATATLVTSCASSGGTGGSTSTAPQKSLTGIIPYPLKVCIVTDNDLGSMGDEQRIVHEGREVKFCCAPCVDKFRKNPAKYLAKLM